MKKIYGTFGVEMRAYGQKLVKFCTHTDTHVNLSSIDNKKSHLHQVNLKKQKVVLVEGLLKLGYIYLDVACTNNTVRRRLYNLAVEYVYVAF